ncbi:hypothetical protein TRVA0_017S01200 [Trichomonascus vanleenenianus]|uniref:ribonuclease H family protein n=1 Tax=Trichomonascus vanleenenianus TaxID=2268995 RepID=UPI003EC96332
MPVFCAVIWKTDRPKEIVSKKTLIHYLNSERLLSEIKRYATFQDYESCCQFLGLGLYQTVYADGACRHNGTSKAYGGIGIYHGRNDPRNISRPLPDSPTTNQVAELTALYVACSQALNEFKRNKYSRPITLVTDSMYAINCVSNWNKKWEKNGWRTVKGGPVANAELIKKVLRLIRDLNNTYDRRGYGAHVLFDHVPGHSTNVGNNEADRLANLGADQFVR